MLRSGLLYGTLTPYGRVVDEDVQLAETRNRRLDGVAPVFLAGHVQMQVDGVLPRFGDLRGHLGALLVQNVAYDDFGALLG